MTAMPAPRCAVQVCMLCPGSVEASGGVGRFAGNLAAELRRSGAPFDISLLNTRGDGHIALSPLFFARTLASIALRSRRARRPILHVNVGARGSALRKYVVTLLAASLGLPVVLHLHGSQFDTFYGGLPPVLQRRVRAMFARAARIVVLGPAWKRFVTHHLGVPEARIAVIPNGVPRPAPPADDKPRPHIVFLGRLGVRKGVFELLKALSSPGLKQQDWHATLAGDGDPRAFQAEAATLGIAQRLSFPGWLSQHASAELLRSATLLVLPSHAEGLPMAVIEALAYGVPIITTPVGAIPDFLAHDDSALFVPPGDADALAQSLQRLIASPGLQRRLRDRGREVFAQHFDVAEVARAFAAIYAELAPAASRSR